MGTVSPVVRRTTVMVIAGIVVSYVRHILQYGHPWTSIMGFFGSSIVHYFCVGIVAVLSYAIIKKTETIFFKYEGSEKGLTFDQSIFYTSVIILISAIFILVVTGHYYFG